MSLCINTPQHFFNVRIRRHNTTNNVSENTKKCKKQYRMDLFLHNNEKFDEKPAEKPWKPSFFVGRSPQELYKPMVSLTGGLFFKRSDL